MSVTPSGLTTSVVDSRVSGGRAPSPTAFAERLAVSSPVSPAATVTMSCDSVAVRPSVASASSTATVTGSSRTLATVTRASIFIRPPSITGSDCSTDSMRTGSRTRRRLSMRIGQLFPPSNCTRMLNHWLFSSGVSPQCHMGLWSSISAACHSPGATSLICQVACIPSARGKSTIFTPNQPHVSPSTRRSNSTRSHSDISIPRPSRRSMQPAGPSLSGAR